MPSLYGEASSLLQGANRTRQVDDELALERAKIREARDVRTAEAISGGLTEGAKQFGENRRVKATNAAALERERIQQTGALEREQAQIDAQFITITPQLAKGAIGVTGDNGWNDLIGQKLRADVYSGMLSSAIKMSEQRQPKTFEIQEGDQVYTAEYDPTTRQLRKLTAGSNKFSPTERGEKAKEPKKLNVFTLQNIVRQDENTLRTALGGKGRKGIPSEGIIPGFSDKETAQLANLKSVAARLKTNYQNLSQLEADNNLQSTAPDAEVIAAIDKLLAQPEEGASGTKIRVQAPNGQFGFIPKDKLQEKLKLGYKLAPKQ